MQADLSVRKLNIQHAFYCSKQEKMKVLNMFNEVAGI